MHLNWKSPGVLSVLKEEISRCDCLYFSEKIKSTTLFETDARIWGIGALILFREPILSSAAV